MKRVKTAKGRMLDMSALAAKNETTRAVSNLPINARGDIIDNRGNVEVSRETISKEYYKDNVPGSDVEEISIQAEEKAADVTVPPVTPKKAEVKKTPTPVPTPKNIGDKVTEVGRTARTRDNGTSYFEVEYSDGSMEDLEIGGK
tara:strand:- start:481 stop:912 length:432 start_codon:yes stop_codon:yes gene_type:complete